MSGALAEATGLATANQEEVHWLNGESARLTAATKKAADMAEAQVLEAETTAAKEKYIAKAAEDALEDAVSPPPPPPPPPHSACKLGSSSCTRHWSVSLTAAFARWRCS